MEPRRSRESEPERWKAAGALGRLAGTQGWLDHSPQSVLAELRRPRGGHQGHASVLPQSLPEASRAALVGFPEAPSRRGGAGSVSAPPGGESLAGGTPRSTRSLRECMVSAYCVPCAWLRAQRGLSPACPPGAHRGTYDLLVPSVSPVPRKAPRTKKLLNKCVLNK